MNSKVFSDWLPSYIKASRPVLEIFKMVEYFQDSPSIHQFVRKFTGEGIACAGELMKRPHFSGRRISKKQNGLENLNLAGRIILNVTL